MKNKIIAGLIVLAFFMLGAPIHSEAKGRRGAYKRGYRAGYRTAVRQSNRVPRYYAPRPVYRGYRYAHPPGRAYGYRARIARAPARVWIPADRAYGPRGWYRRPGHYERR